MGKISPLVKTYNRIFFKNRTLLGFSILFPLVFYVFFTLIFTNYEDVNQVPIGVVDYDQTQLSQKLVENLKKHPSLNLVSYNLEEGKKLLNRNKIEALFLIKDGFEAKLKSGLYEGSIDLVYLDKSTIAPALGDIVAATMISDLSVYHAANYILKYEEKYDLDNLFKKVEAMGYSLLDSNTFEMTVQSTVRQPDSKLDETMDIQGILKSHITFGFSLVVFSFVFLFANSHLIDGKTLGIEDRLITAGYTRRELFTSQWLSLFITGLALALCQMIFIIYTFKVFEVGQVLLLVFTYTMVYIFLINLTMLMTRMIDYKNRYQSFIAPLLFLLGLVGGAFWSIELIADNFLWASKLSPFYWSLKLLDQMLLSVYSRDLYKWLVSFMAFNLFGFIINYGYHYLYYRKKYKLK